MECEVRERCGGMAKKKVKASDVVKTEDKQVHDKLYNDYVKRVTPVNNRLINMLNAFLFGGAICAVGQGIMDAYRNLAGLEKEQAQTAASITLVLIAVILTGLNLYQKLAKYAGAGTLVPITGFANSVAAPAIEFQKEGQVFGIGCKIFTIAGPVILYGIFASWVLGLGYWIVSCMR